MEALNATRGASGLVKRCNPINAKPKAFARICNLVDRLSQPRVVEPILVSIGDQAPAKSVATESPRVDLELLKV